MSGKAPWPKGAGEVVSHMGPSLGVWYFVRFGKFAGSDYLRRDDGRICRFRSEEKARAALAAATGETK